MCRVRHATSHDVLLRALVIGYGSAARRFHLPALLRLQSAHALRAPVGVVDPAAEWAVDPTGRLAFSRTLAGLEPDFSPNDTVVHICTPPHTHATVIRQCAEAGYRRVIVEKPLVTTRTDLTEVKRLAAEAELDVLVVANWLSSKLTEAVSEYLRADRSGVERITLRSSKPRIAKSLASTAHATAFEVEMPHMIALASHLCGPDLHVRSAHSRDLVVDGRCVLMMGAADLLLRSGDGHDVHLVTDLRSPRRERSVFVRLRDGRRLIGHFPCHSDDLYSQLSIVASDGHPLDHRIFEDDTVYAFVAHAHGYFAGRREKPRSDLEFHARGTELLVEARDLCVPVPAGESGAGRAA